MIIRTPKFSGNYLVQIDACSFQHCFKGLFIGIDIRRPKVQLLRGSGLFCTLNNFCSVLLNHENCAGIGLFIHQLWGILEISVMGHIKPKCFLQPLEYSNTYYMNTTNNAVFSILHIYWEEK